MRATRIIVPLLLTIAGCAKQAPPQTAAPAPQACTEVGMATWYHGRRDRDAPHDTLVAAHKTLPIGTPVQVTEVGSGRSVVVHITDRGPYAKGRIIDLSTAAATQLGMRRDGVVPVRLEVDAPADQGCPFDDAQMPRVAAE
jgi:rare lipoprotein A